MGIHTKLQGLMEELAAIEHERWAHWQRYMHGRAVRQPDGGLLVPPELVAKWERQMTTPYADLPASEKASDREQVQRYLPVIAKALSDDSAQSTDDDIY